MKLLGSFAAVTGLVVLVLSFLWTSFFPPEDSWSIEQAQAHRQASAKYHELQHTIGGPSRVQKGRAETTKPRPTKADLDAAKREWEEVESARRAAQESGKQTAWWLRLSGVALATIGAVALLLNKKKSQNGRA
jgi:hypothetical protein